MLKTIEPTPWSFTIEFDEDFTGGSRKILSVKERRSPAFPALRRGWVRVKPEMD